MTNNLKRAAISIAIGSALTGMSPVAVQAQGVSQLEEVLVTARRREESLQEVPISVVAFGGDDLEIRGLEQIEDLSARVPNISLIGGGATGDAVGSFVMRGVPGVGTYIDGVWQATTDGLLRGEFVEIERVEVLRGPQGTLFGKNTTGGAINIVTARPEDEFGARVRATIGSFNRADVSIGVDVPFTDTFRAKFTGAQLTRDGFIHSTKIDRSFGDIDNTVMRADFVWEPTDTFDLRFIYENNDRDENGSARIQNGFIEDGSLVNQVISRSQYYTAAGVDLTNVAAATNYPGGQLGKWETRSSLDTDGLILDIASATLDMNWNLSDTLSIRSITNHRTTFSRIYTDFDAQEIHFFEDDRNRDQRQSTQEFQLTGGGDRINWVGGLYFWDQFDQERRFRHTYEEFRTGALDFSLVQAAAIAAGGTANDVRLAPGSSDEFDGTGTEGWAVFGEVEYNLTDALTLTVGYRHQDEDIEQLIKTPTDLATQPGGVEFVTNFTGGQRYPNHLLFDGSIASTQTGNFESDTGRVSLAYQISDDVMVYGTYSEGFGAGGVSSTQVQIVGVPTDIIQPFMPEELENFEIGLRSDLLDGRLRFNLTYFDGTWTGIQVAETVEDQECILGVGPYAGQGAGTPASCPNLPNLLTFNAGEAEVDGAEIEIIARPSDSWRFDANFGFLNTEYTDTGTSQDIQPGDTFAQAPELTYSVGAQWNGDLTNGGEVMVRLDYAYTDDYVRARERQRQTGQESFGLVNARFAYTPPAGNWRLAIFGSNLTDEWYLNSGFLSTGTTQDLATIGRPREIGASMEFFFD